MAKITVISKPQQIEGEIIEGKVTYFGTSAHIACSKCFVGRKVKVIIPTNGLMYWIFEDKLKEEFVLACLEQWKTIPNNSSKQEKKDSIESLRKDEFNYLDLMQALFVLNLSDKKKDIELVKKIEKGYGL